MKSRLLYAFIAMVLMIVAMRWQGGTLVSTITPRGIIDLEFAHTAERLQQLQQTWQWKDVLFNILLDFIFIAAYVWFFVSITYYIMYRNDWTKIGRNFTLLALLAGLLDIVENILMLLVYTNSASAHLLPVIYYVAVAKFVIIVILIFYILISLPFIRKKKEVLVDSAARKS